MNAMSACVPPTYPALLSQKGIAFPPMAPCALSQTRHRHHHRQRPSFRPHLDPLPRQSWNTPPTLCSSSAIAASVAALHRNAEVRSPPPHCCGPHPCLPLQFLTLFQRHFLFAIHPYSGMVRALPPTTSDSDLIKLALV